MSTEPVEAPLVEEDPHALMERTFILEYLKSHGHTLESLHQLPEEQVRKLMTEASTYASVRLTELEARARFVTEVHGTVSTAQSG